MLIAVLTALGVVVVIGLFLGILLSLADYLLGVEENQLTKQVRGALPGINCGACGFKGCNDYAEALSAGLDLGSGSGPIKHNFGLSTRFGE